MNTSLSCQRTNTSEARIHATHEYKDLFNHAKAGALVVHDLATPSQVQVTRNRDQQIGVLQDRIRRELLRHVPDKLGLLWKPIRRAWEDYELVRFQHTIRKGIDLIDVYGSSTGIRVDVHVSLRESTLDRTTHSLAIPIVMTRRQIVPAESSDPRFSRLFAMNAFVTLLVFSRNDIFHVITGQRKLRNTIFTG